MKDAIATRQEVSDYNEQAIKETTRQKVADDIEAKAKEAEMEAAVAHDTAKEQRKADEVVRSVKEDRARKEQRRRDREAAAMNGGGHRAVTEETNEQSSYEMKVKVNF